MKVALPYSMINDSTHTQNYNQIPALIKTPLYYNYIFLGNDSCLNVEQKNSYRLYLLEYLQLDINVVSNYRVVCHVKTMNYKHCY